MAVNNNGIVFIDSFDNWATADSPGKWNVLTAFAASVSAGSGRNGTSSLHNSGGGPVAVKTLTAQARRGVGAAFKTNILPISPTAIMAFTDAGNTQVDLRVNADGTFSVTRNGTVLATSSFALVITTWYYIEFFATVDPLVGTYDVWVNTLNHVITGSSANTRATANSTSNGFSLSGFSFASTDWDDLYAAEGVNATNIGDHRVSVKKVNGAGNYSQWTPNSGTNFSRVDQTTPDGDTTYNSAATAPLRDSYGMAALGLTGTIHGVQANAWIRNTDANATTEDLFLRIGGVDYDGASNFNPNITYAWVGQFWENSPATSNAPTVTEIDGAEVGIQRST